MTSKVIKKCNSILVEVNEEFKIQYNEVKRILESNNFKIEKAFKASNEKTELFDKCYNQIWKKNQ